MYPMPTGIIDLCSANLRGADLQGVDLHNATLWRADLRDANLRDADLSGATLWRADLWGADLWGADLYDADLRDIVVSPSQLAAVRWDGLTMIGLPSGDAALIPTIGGWHLRVGCWSGTVEELRTIALSDSLLRLADICDGHIQRHTYVIADLIDRWGTR